MKIYLVRHGIAFDGSPTGRDYDRELTPEGIEKMERSARTLANAGVKPTFLFSSPLIRARQTAEILATELTVTMDVRAEVGPGFDVQQIDFLLSEFSSDDDAMFVGHNPDMPMTISALCGGGSFDVKKGSVARIDVMRRMPTTSGVLVWLLPPRILAL